MSRQLRLYKHPLMSVSKQAYEQTEKSAPPFLRYIPRDINPITHIIIPQSTGLNPNAHLTPLKGYRLEIKGKLLEKTLRSNKFNFRTGNTRRSDYHGHHFQEGYSVSGPFGSIGIKVYYEYDLTDYFTHTQVFAPHQQTQSETKKVEIERPEPVPAAQHKQVDDQLGLDFAENQNFEFDLSDLEDEIDDLDDTYYKSQHTL